MTKEELAIIELNEENIESMIYIIRDQRVMLDFDLARIYGYSTRRFNEQVKNNIERFDEDFIFHLTKDEFENLVMSRVVNSSKDNDMRSKKSTARIWTIGNTGGRTSLPYAFTEKGIYMLMTVLRGPLAVQQSKTLIRLFERLKNYYVETNGALAYNEIIKLTKKVDKHDRDIKKTNKKLDQVMENFIDSSTYKHFLILNGQKIEADIAYQQIYALAKHSIIVIDDYIDVKTLRNLKACESNIEITICSDNIAKNRLVESDFIDFKNDTGIRAILKPTYGNVHDRYIVIDYKENNELIYACGSSSKDAGNKVTTIMEIEYKNGYHPLIDILLDNHTIL